MGGKVMRGVKIAVLVLLAAILLGVAVANRGMVTVSLLPQGFSSFFGVNWTLQLPLFLVILLAAALGLLIGFVWEFLREHRIRAAAIESQREAQRLRAELASLRRDPPKDDVIALLERRDV